MTQKDVGSVDFFSQSWGTVTLRFLDRAQNLQGPSDQRRFESDQRRLKNAKDFAISHYKVHCRMVFPKIRCEKKIAIFEQKS